MKFLRVLCNIFLLIAICFTMSIGQLLVFDVLAAQSSDIEAIHISDKDGDQVAYFDSYTFWFSDIKTNLEQPAKYRIRNWFNGEGWKNAMGWADRCLDFVIGATKPILVPIAEINAVKNYYNMEINDFNEYLLKYYDGDLEKLNNSLFELYNIYERGYGKCFIIEKDTNGNLISTKEISEWNYTGDVSENTEYGYKLWLSKRGNKQLYNTTWKLNKYNSGAYDKYFNKFLIVNEGEARHIKPAAIVLYYQQYVSLIVSIIFVCKYPINFVTGRYIGKRHKRESTDDINL